MPKLFEIRECSIIKCACSDGSSFVVFRHIDGAYSYCVTERGGVAHLFGGLLLEESPDGDGAYTIAE